MNLKNTVVNNGKRLAKVKRMIKVFLMNIQHSDSSGANTRPIICPNLLIHKTKMVHSSDPWSPEFPCSTDTTSEGSITIS